MTKPENPRAVAGDNSGESHAVAADELRAFLERIERVGEEIQGLQSDRRDIFAEAKGRGYDTAVMRQVLKIRAADREHLQEQAAIRQTYCEALGMEDVFA